MPAGIDTTVRYQWLLHLIVRSNQCVRMIYGPFVDWKNQVFLAEDINFRSPLFYAIISNSDASDTSVEERYSELYGY